jgi:hypothetical protein
MDTEAYHMLPGSALIDRFGYRECSPSDDHTLDYGAYSGVPKNASTFGEGCWSYS